MDAINLASGMLRPVCLARLATRSRMISSWSHEIHQWIHNIMFLDRNKGCWSVDYFRKKKLHSSWNFSILTSAKTKQKSIHSEPKSRGCNLENGNLIGRISLSDFTEDVHKPFCITSEKSQSDLVSRRTYMSTGWVYHNVYHITLHHIAS